MGGALAAMTDVDNLNKTMMEKLELGNQVFGDLGQEFLSTVFGAAKTGRSSVVCGVPAVAEGDVPMSRIFLNPFAEGECAGVDLVGKSIVGVCPGGRRIRYRHFRGHIIHVSLVLPIL